MDEVVAPSLLGDCLALLPPADWPGWVRYRNDCEQKRTSRDFVRLSGVFSSLCCEVNSARSRQSLSGITGIADLEPDWTYHGGGIHISDPGDYLQPHLDYALHPVLHLERRLNVVLFLNPQWEPAWGGALQFYDDLADKVIAEFSPQFNRAILWEPTDLAYHGVSAVTGPQSRITLALSFLCPPRPGVCRKRALFCPRRRAA